MLTLAETFINIFSAVGSGPAGIEGIIGGSGGLPLALAGAVIFPFLWGYPQAVAALDLSLRFTKDGGAVTLWTSSLFGRNAARNVALWSVAVQCCTAALVSEVSLTYTEVFFGIDGEAHSYVGMLGFSVVIILLSGAINAVSLTFTARAFSWFTVNSLLAFGTLCILSMVEMSRRGPRALAARFSARTPSQSGWAEIVNLLVYNSGGFDSVASLVHKIDRPER